MKKYTSAALLALKLTWKTALTVFTLVAALETIDVCRELMPGGVPLQTTFGFEALLRSAVQPAGKWWMGMLMAFLAATGREKKGKSVYTMNRLGLSELQSTLVFGGVFTVYFLLYWALQLGLAYAYFVWYTRLGLVSSNAFMLACWRSEWLHLLLPLGEWWNYLRNFIICTSFGFCAAFASQQSRRGKVALTWFIAPVLCALMLNGQVGSFGQDVVLMLLLSAFTIGYFFVLKGGREDEDL